MTMNEDDRKYIINQVTKLKNTLHLFSSGDIPKKLDETIDELQYLLTDYRRDIINEVTK